MVDEELTREDAIDRIIEVRDLVFGKRYRDLEECTSEPNYVVHRYMKILECYFKDNPVTREDLSKFSYDDFAQWTNDMLYEIIDNPYLRKRDRWSFRIVD